MSLGAHHLRAMISLHLPRSLHSGIPAYILMLISVVMLTPLLWTQQASPLAQTSSACFQSSATSWTNAPFPQQTAPFTAYYDATPSQANIDGVIGFSFNAATDYTSLAAITRFADTGSIDVRNGAAYSADTAVAYLPGVSYHFRVVIDLPNHSYSVYVTPAGGIEVALASNYAFRAEQSTLSDLNNWGMIAEPGSLSVCNMTILSPTGNFTSYPVAYLNADPFSLSFGSISVGSNSSLSSTLNNSGNTNVTIWNVSVSGPGFNASGVSTGQILNPGQSATLDITFAPAGAGNVTGAVTITSNASNSPTTISLAGSGTQDLTSRSVTLSWIPSTSVVAGYNIYRSTVRGGPYEKLNTALVATTAYLDSGIFTGQTYFYVATAVATNGAESVFSNEASATIP